MNKNIAIILILFAFNMQARTFYVAKNGNDSNDGSEASPWLSIKKAANTLVAGDTVLIKSGIYRERVIVGNSGTKDNYIVFKNYKKDIVTVDGRDIFWWDWDGLFNVSEKSYIKIIGLAIKNSNYGGIWIEDSNNIIINNNYTYNTISCGIGVWGSSNIIVSENEVELACNDGEQECISIANSNNCIITKNHIHDNGAGTNGGEGIDVKAGSHDIIVSKNIVHNLNNRIGIYVDAWDSDTYNIDIIQNRVYYCDDTGLAVASERGGLLENINFFNNISYYNKWGGIELGGWTDVEYSGPTPIKNVKFINNTCYKNGSFNGGWGFGISVNNSYAENVIIRNNICSENTAQIGIEKILSAGVIDHNLIYGDNNVATTTNGSNPIIGDPLFVDVENFNFHISNNSPAIDNGSSIDVPNIDFSNTNRPYGARYDIGAYEFTPQLDVDINEDYTKMIDTYPNPFSDILHIKINGEKFQKYFFKIFNSRGELVRKETSKKLKNGIVIIDKLNLSTGIYILSITIDSKTLVSKKIICK